LPTLPKTSALIGRPDSKESWPKTADIELLTSRREPYKTLATGDAVFFVVFSPEKACQLHGKYVKVSLVATMKVGRA
jgi:hypothetical protein